MIVQYLDTQLGSPADGSLALFGASVVGNNIATIMDLDIATGKA
jgi:hypothetical protein